MEGHYRPVPIALF